MRGVAIIAGPLVLAAACTSFSSSSDVGAADAGSEAQADAPADTFVPGDDDAGDGAGLPGVDDFEGTSKCAPWSGSGAMVNVVAGGANGSAHACRVCATGPNGDARRSYDVVAGDYVFDAFEQAPSTTLGWTVYVKVLDGDGGGGAVDFSNVGSLGTTFQAVQASGIHVPVAGQVNVYLYMSGSMNGDCFDFDQATLH